MSALPSVSVCIPVYNGAEFLAETVRSVLDQTYRDFELVVLDNASTDATNAIAHSVGDPRVRVETNPTTLPQAKNWHEVIRRCRAPLIKVVCADDLLHPRCLEYQVGPMDADPGLAVVAARRHMIDERSRVLVPRRGLTGLTGIRSSVEVARRVVRSGANPIGESNGVLFRREHYFAVGGWRAERPWTFDLDMWVRLLQYGEFLGLPETLAAFRIGRQSLTADNEAAIYAEQKAFLDELAASPHLQVRRSDLMIGRWNAPAGRARRRLLYRLSHRAALRDEQLQQRADSAAGTAPVGPTGPTAPGARDTRGHEPQNRGEQNRGEQNRGEQNRGEQNRGEQNWGDAVSAGTGPAER